MTENKDILPDETRKQIDKSIDKLQEYNYKSEYLLKICVNGSGFKLKAKFIRSVTGEREGLDDQTRLTLGVDISGFKITIKNTPTKIFLVNTAGQEFFGKLRPNYYRGASASVIVFDKSDRPTFDAVPDWLEEFRKHIPSPDVPIALVGINTKEEDVSSDEGKALAELVDLPYFETSSPKFEKAIEIFVYLSEQVIK
jgi:GTPase SAR1 family protein